MSVFEKYIRPFADLAIQKIKAGDIPSVNVVLTYPHHPTNWYRIEVYSCEDTGILATVTLYSSLDMTSNRQAAVNAKWVYKNEQWVSEFDTVVLN